MGIFLWIVFGLVAGSVAKLVMPGPDRLGIVGTMLVGVAGAIVGGLIGAVLGGSGVIGTIFAASIGHHRVAGCVDQLSNLLDASMGLGRPASTPRKEGNHL
jgi:uncharacterized membrane protein YeaQ/YmgE (transglycosylase-associated protein family)